MTRSTPLTRRALLAAAPLAGGIAIAKNKKIPIGLELYSLRNELQKDLFSTVRAVGKMGYECVEFYGPYYDWTPAYAKDVRKVVDETGMKCLSTHNGNTNFQAANLPKAIELNNILGAKYMVMASSGKVVGLDGWKKVADLLNSAVAPLKAAGLASGYHNHQTEFKELEGKRPIEVIAANTDKSVILQLDVGTCVEVGQDPVAWINQNPGRLKSIHCKEWSKDKGYKALFAEGASPWKQIFEAAEKKGGVEFYLIEQEGADNPDQYAVVDQCLKSIKKMRA